jgi:hypothetical protein
MAGVNNASTRLQAGYALALPADAAAARQPPTEPEPAPSVLTPIAGTTGSDSSGAAQTSALTVVGGGAAFRRRDRKQWWTAMCASFSSSDARELVLPPLRRPFVALWLCWFALSFGWYGLSLWIPTLFERANLNIDVYQDSFLVAAASLPGNIIATLLMDRLGRKRLLTASLVLACGATAAFAFSTTEASAVAAACIMNLVSVGAWNSLDCLAAESFPTSVRTTALGLQAAGGRLGSIAGQFVFGALVNLSITALLLSAAFMLLLGGVAALALPHDTAAVHLADFVPEHLPRTRTGGSRKASDMVAGSEQADTRMLFR